MTGDGEARWAERGPYDRVFVSSTVTRAPLAWVERLAPEGRALVNVTGTSPSWPGLAVINKTLHGAVEAELRPVKSGHRPGHGFDRVFLSREFLDRTLADQDARPFHGRQAPPPDEARAVWLALQFQFPNLVRNFSADHLVIGTPACGSWLTARPDPAGGWTPTAHGPRDSWDEIHQVAARWRIAGRPEAYRLKFGSRGEQWTSAGAGRDTLSWQLTDPQHLPKGDQL